MTPRRKWSHMHYNNFDMQLDQFINYVNEGKINLIPSFQRGRVWSPTMRRKLIENIVRERPIPAIFLYKQASGDKYQFNILDGKQRLESLILFVGNKRPSLKINDINSLFFQKRYRDLANFSIEVEGKKQSLRDLDNELFRKFQGYIIPTIQISMDEEHPTSLDEIIDLFVDINSLGAKVKRFDITKAMSKDRLLKNTFELIAVTRPRGEDTEYKAQSNVFTKVLKRLQVVDSVRDKNAKVDKMWELLVEIILFIRTGKHRNPTDILKSFMKVEEGKGEPRISAAEKIRLRKIFDLLWKAYKQEAFTDTRLVTNQIHFYTMITAIISKDLSSALGEGELIRKLTAFGRVLDGKANAPQVSAPIATTIENYKELSEKQSTHVGRRGQREQKFIEAINAL